MLGAVQAHQPRPVTGEVSSGWVEADRGGRALLEATEPDIVAIDTVGHQVSARNVSSSSAAEPVVLYQGRTKQAPVFKYLALPAAIARMTFTPPRVIGAARKLLLARIARFADDKGVAKPDQRDRYEDGTAYLGARGLGRAIGISSHTAVLTHLDELAELGVISRERSYSSRVASTITILPARWYLWSETILPIPEALMESGMVSHQAVIVYAVIAYLNGSLGPRPISRTELMNRVGLSSLAGLRRYIGELKKAGLIEVEKRRGGKALFVLVMHPWLRQEGALIHDKVPTRWGKRTETDREANRNRPHLAKANRNRPRTTKSEPKPTALINSLIRLVPDHG